MACLKRCEGKSIKQILTPSQRWIFAILSSIAIILAFTMRGSLAISIIVMVNHTGKNGTKISPPCPREPEQRRNSSTEDVRYNWTQAQQGIALSTFYYGYILTHIPGSMLAEKFGGKYVLSLGILSTGICTLLTPIVVQKFESIGLCVLRAIMSLGEGTTFPALGVMVAAWVPPKERAVIGSLIFGSLSAANVATFFVSGLILREHSWHVIFYLWGSIAVIWFILHTIFCYSDPESHPFISKEERDYLKSEMGALKRDANTPPTPWRDILTSIPMISIIIAQIGHDWIVFILSSFLPKYMKEVVGFSVYNTGLYTSLTYVGQWVVSIVTGFICDFLTHRGILSIGAARKLFTALAAFGPGGFVLFASYSECNKPLVVTNFVLGMCFMGFFYAGLRINVLDLSPNYSGTLMALMNGLGAVGGMAGPSVVGLMIPNSAVHEWREAFWLVFGVVFVTTVIYIFGGSGDIQLWNYPKTWKSTEDITINDAKTEKIESEDKKHTD